jgi:cellulose synthase operon protein C
MQRRALTMAAVLAAALAGTAPARAQEDMRVARQYVEGLRDKEYYDLAEEFLERLKTDPNTPDDLRPVIDYEMGKLRIDNASKTGDLVLRKEQLDKARADLVTFTQTHPKHPLAPEAFVQLARLLVERGHLEMLRAGETDNEKEKKGFLADARASFDEARTAYGQADTKLTAAFKAFPPFIPDNDPRKQERDRAHTAMMDAQLQKAVVDYEEGQTFPLGSKERGEYLTKGLEQFEDIYKRYRTQFAGLTAQMWQAKCYEEKGDIGQALGIYNQLLEHQDPRLRPLQRHVGYFKIIAHAKRKEYPLAERLAGEWLRVFGSRAELNSNEGLGVRLELAKDLLEEAKTAEDPAEKTALKNRAIDQLAQVVRISSPHKAEALKLYKELKPKSAILIGDIAKLSYEDATSQAEQAIAAHEFERAEPLLKQAIRKADPTKDATKANTARHLLAYCYYMDKRYYEADVLAEHLARRYPYQAVSSKSLEIGMASLAEAYNTYTAIDRTSDLNRLVDLALYAVETWPDKGEGDVARMTLGQIYHGTGKYPKAIAIYESVTPKSPKWVEAQTKAGASHWEESQSLRRAGKTAEADEEVKKALGTLNAALKARRDAGTAATDEGLVANICDIADVELETGKAADALALLEPTAQAAQSAIAAGNANPVFSRLMAALLRAHINNDQVDKAQADMAALEKLGGGASLAQLYFQLGKLLEKEMKALQEKGDGARLAQRQASYQKFLSALANAKAGQTYDSLEWAGENMLKLGNSKEASELFKKILATAEKDPAFLGQGAADERRLRTQLQLAAALRAQRDFAGAEELVKELEKDHPRALEPMFERGLLLEDKAAAGQGQWSASMAHWQTLAQRLGSGRVKRPEYYDAWYHAGLALFKMGQGAKAKQLLGGVRRLSPKLGGSKEIQEKYEQLLKQIR